MTVIEMLRAATTADDGVHRRPEARAALTGAATAGASLALPLIVVFLAAFAVPRASAGVGDALGSGSLLWLVLGGARLSIGEGTIALTPILGVVLLLVVARVGARRGLPEDPELPTQGAWLGGYAAVGLLAALLGLLSPLAVAPLSLALPMVLVPALALAWAHGLPQPLPQWWERIPWAVRRGLAPGAKGALATVLAGSVLVLIATAVNFGRVMHVHAELEAGFFGGLLLMLLQALLLPNIGIWGISFAAGPGFSTTGGSMTTWSAAEAGALPMVPALAAQPQPGDLPWITPLLIILPILIGAWLGREALTWVPRLAATQSKLAVIATAVLTAALGVVALDALGGGSLGAAQLSDLGAPAVSLGLALGVELGVGALAVLAREWWVLRR